jgi:DNA-binding response OmpR family regulator
MTRAQAQRLTLLTTQMTEHLMTAAICAEELRAAVHAELDGDGSMHAEAVPDRMSVNQRPFVDRSTLSVWWAGKRCHLGFSVLFRLIERLSRRPNQIVSAEQLLVDVWDGDLKSPDTIRSAVRHLRERLTRAGMAELASAIHGQGGGYALILARDQ